jgi:plastocyanin
VGFGGTHDDRSASVLRFLHVDRPSSTRQIWTRRALWASPLVAAIMFFGFAVVVTHRSPAEGANFRVSQRNREFNPADLTVKRGDVVRIVNDDGDLTHHAYVQSSSFNFDSGDQAPGRDVNITFNVPGTFNVLCGIHPKMRLTVTVEP